MPVPRPSAIRSWPLRRSARSLTPDRAAAAGRPRGHPAGLDPLVHTPPGAPRPALVPRGAPAALRWPSPRSELRPARRARLLSRRRRHPPPTARVPSWCWVAAGAIAIAATWSLPKGTPDGDETPEETALREVNEETGLEVRILDTIGDIHYRFVRDGRRIDKTVHYYLMEATGGDLADHDHEFEEVRWFELGEAEARDALPDRARHPRPGPARGRPGLSR